MRELEIERLAALEGAAQAEISHCQQAVVLRLTFRCVLWIKQNKHPDALERTD
jgi:hypothetical protein